MIRPVPSRAYPFQIYLNKHRELELLWHEPPAKSKREVPRVADGLIDLSILDEPLRPEGVWVIISLWIMHVRPVSNSVAIG